jgi:predicted small lipoprotein YifL
VLQAVNRVQPVRMFGRLQLGILAVLLLGALSLAGCGVRGPLETPPAAASETGGATPGTPGTPVPHKPSILDPLIR